MTSTRSAEATPAGPRIGLRAKLVRVYALQVLLISAAAMVGMYITYVIVQDVLTRQALNGEAEHFWRLFEADPRHPLPNVDNMRGFLRTPSGQVLGDGKPPPYLAALQPGFGAATGVDPAPLVHVSERDGHRLYLIFAEAEVSDLVFYFGLAPLSAVLLTIYALLFAAYRLSQRAISPMLALARSLQHFDFATTHELDIPELGEDADNETRTMVQSLEHFVARLDRFVERERNFTRDAGHELRTPVAVLKGSLDLLETNRDRPETEKKTLARMRRVLDDTETLLETLLLLAREQELLPPAEETSVNDVVAEQLETLTTLATERCNELVFDERADCVVMAPDRVVAIVAGNLLRNALTYTQDGTVTATINANSLTVADTGIGMSGQDVEAAFGAFYRSDAARASGRGHGLGLAIVKRLADQFNWRVTVSSEVGQGTTFKVDFDAES